MFGDVDPGQIRKCVQVVYVKSVTTYNSRAIRAENWSQIGASMVKDGWQFRNLLKPEAGDSDIDDVFWSSDGEPDNRQGVIYIRKQPPRR